MATMIFSSFQKSWFDSHPHDRVVRVKVSKNNWSAIISILAGLIAVNILSAAHTIPVIATTVATDVEQIKVVVGVSAFFAIEFTMFIMMVLTIEHYLRYFVIGLALVVAIVANVTSTVRAVESSEYAAGGQIVGIVLGLFAPLANLAAGEMLRSIIKQAADRVSEANISYEQRLKDQDAKIRSQYVTYLRKVGITNPTEIMELMGNVAISGQNSPNSDVAGVVTNSGYRVSDRTTGVSGAWNNVDADIVEQRTNRNVGGKSTAASRLAEKIRQDGTGELSYTELRERYGGSPNTIQKAKQLL